MSSHIAASPNQLPCFPTLGGETCLRSRNLTLSEKKSCVCIETTGGTTWVRMRLLGENQTRINMAQPSALRIIQVADAVVEDPKEREEAPIP